MLDNDSVNHLRICYHDKITIQIVPAVKAVNTQTSLQITAVSTESLVSLRKVLCP